MDEKKKKKEKKQRQMVILKEKSVETLKKIKDLIKGLEELESSQEDSEPNVRYRN